MKKIKLSQADIDKNPLLKKIGAIAGQTMEYSFVSSEKATSNESTTEESGDDDEGDDGNGGNHPPKKGGN